MWGTEEEASGGSEPGNSLSCDQNRQQIEKELTLKGMSYAEMLKIEKVLLGMCTLALRAESRFAVSPMAPASSRSKADLYWPSTAIRISWDSVS